jgi:L-lysine 2,3-aminomutase
VSEAESPELLGAARRVTPEDIRALAGASTPHFALQVRNRIRRLIEPLAPDDPTRLEGERKIAELEELAEHSGDPRGTMGIGHR